MTLLIFSLQFAIVQTYVTKHVARYLSKELQAEINLSAVYFKPFSSLTLHDLEINDPKGNRIIFTKRLYTNLRLTQLLQNKIHIKDLKLTEAYVDYRIFKDSSNFRFLIDYFAPSKEEEKPKKESIQFSLHKMEFENCHFIVVDETKRHHNRGVDFSDIELTAFSGILDDIQLDSASNKATIKNLTFREKSGLYLQNFSANSQIGAKFMEFDGLNLQTNRSLLKNYLRFDYDTFSDFADFIKKVHITAEMKDSFVDSRDIEFFAPSMKQVRFTTSIHQAHLKGTVADISVTKTHLSTAQNTSLAGDLTIKGLPDIDKTRFDLNNITLSSSSVDVEYLVPELANIQKLELPQQIHQLGYVEFRGNFQGFYNNFTVDGLFHTELGNLETTTSIDIRSGLAYEGNILSENFDLGKFLQTSTLAHTGLDLSFDGKETDLSKLELDFDGHLNHFGISSFTLQSVKLAGNIKDQTLNMEGNLHDDRAVAAYQFRLDWNTPLPTYYISSDIQHVDLKAFHVIERDSITLSNTTFEANLTGNSINNLSGYFTSKLMNLNTYKGDFTIENIRFEADGDEQNRHLNLTSNVLDAEINGIIDLNTIIPYFESLAMQYAPAIGFDSKPFNEQNFDLNVTVKSFEPVSTFLDPSLQLDDGAYLKANFSSDNYQGKFTFFTPNIVYKGVRLSNLTIHENADENAFSLDILAQRLHLSDSIYVENIAIENILAKDSLHFRIIAADDTSANYLRLIGSIHFEHNKPAFIDFEKSTIVISGDTWAINEHQPIRLSKGKLYFEKFKLSQAEQSVEIDGILSNQQDQLHIDFNRFGLASLEAITKPLGINMRGELNGQLEITSVLKSPHFKANINTSPIVYNDLPIGQLVFHANYNIQQDLIDINISLLDGLNRGLKLKGTYDVTKSEDALQLEGDLNELELVVFQPFLRTLVKDLTGKASGNLQITGNINRPKLSGLAKFNQAGFSVIYLNTAYHIHDQSVLVDKNVAMFNNLKLIDNQRHEAVANGYLDLNKLSDPNIDIDVKASNFMVLNTTYKENNLYYGTAFATGIFRFKGRTSGINIDIDATSNPNTSIHIPFNSAMTVSDSDFIYFVERDSTKANKKENRYFFQGLTMNMDIKLTPDAELNLQTDIGSLKGTGNGEISLKISSLGDFEMFGNYTVNSGKFHFTAQDFINKYFDIKEGGTIRWTGDPSAASINLTAIYQQRTSIGALYNAAGRSGQDERVLAQADMIISGTLNQPDISFDLNFPLTPYVKDELQAYLSDANNVNQQALSLIVRRSFTASSSNEFGREVNNTLLSAGTEIAFNQLNSIISQSLNIDFLDLNIRSLNDASASLRLFGDRLVLTGGISDRRNLQTTDLTFFSNRVATDAELTYRIRRDGSLMFRAYNRLNTRNILFTPTDDYINALGLVYRQEFDTFQEFFKRMLILKRREQKTSKITAEQDSIAGN